MSFAKVLAENCSIHNCATWILENEEWDFAAFYYNGIDHFCHAFMDFHPPRARMCPEDLFEPYREVVTGAYRFHDMMLDRLLQLTPPETTYCWFPTTASITIICARAAFRRSPPDPLSSIARSA